MAVKVKPGLHWGSQGVGNARVVRHQPRKYAHREWNQSKRDKCVAGHKARREDHPGPLTSAMEL